MLTLQPPPNGIAPAPAPAQHRARRTIDTEGCFTQVRGPLLRDAVLSIEAAEPHNAWLTVQVQLPRGKPFEARLLVGADPGRVVAARSKAQRMRQGCRVCVYANGGIRDRIAHGLAVAVLMDVTDILLIDVPGLQHDNPSQDGATA